MADKKNLGGDDRFLRVTKDPRFWEMPEKERKIKIDKRFQSMFHDKRFKLKYTVDKRGRPVSHSSTEDLKRFYNLSDSDQSDEEAPAKEKEKKKKKKKEKSETKVDSESQRGVEEDKGGEEEEDKGGEAVDNLPEKAVKKDKKTLKSKDVQRKRSELLDAPKGPVRGVKVYEEDGEEEEASIESDKDVVEASDDGDSEGGSEEDDEDEEEDNDDDDDEDEEGSGSEVESEEDSDSGPDLARGKGNVETSSDEDEDDDDVEDQLRREREEIEHNWGEMWKDAPRNDNVTRRLAACNMDWDRLKAKDLLALFSSFKPKGGVVLSVKIFPSEFGKERLEAERTQGPLELVTLPENPEKDTEEDRVHREKMREYQFKRMRYFYAVVECDSPETAAKIYEECDGHEYESSSSTIDLRFIPDDVSFDEEPKDVAADVDLASYTPKYFTSAAMATSKVELTWDETDHDRVTMLSRKFKKDEILDMDFQAYLASSSEEEEEEEEEEKKREEEERQKEEELKSKKAEDSKTKVKKTKKSDSDQIAKYRELLKGITDQDTKQQDKAMEMEITWVPGLKETTEQLVKKKLEGKNALTPWEEFLQKKKEKRKVKKKAKAKQGAEGSDLSDDELPPDVDLNDPFFAEELGGTAALKSKSKSKNKKSKEEERTPEEEEELEKRKAEMALLMDDGEDDDKHKHFNYDKIVEHQNLTKRKMKKLQKKNELLEDDDFQVDVKDPRFQAMFTSHLYNLDPSDPSYKKTKATQSIVKEKQRRREETQSRQEAAAATKRKQPEPEQEVAAPAETKKAMDPGLSMLIKSIKNKTEQFQARKKHKTK
ncbi:hypothetical protein ANANG_G00050790 [Anguilla anguilla]|uniref:NUC153 domain-containing protein n=1 Tax=Anguilla anguilla TaxID=7936 RepID=A0A9D3S5F2_ANGAN|nr:hypothetical protein ANANG_G00050790 [Anguilla anguilla]